jgi:hypothetical protein
MAADAPRPPLRFEDPDRFQADVQRAAASGAVAALGVWVVWAVGAVAAVHLPSSFALGPLQALAESPRVGLLLAGGDGLGAGALPLLPVLTLVLCLAAARRFLAERLRGRVAMTAPPSVKPDREGLETTGVYGGVSGGVRVARPVPVSPVGVYLACAAAGTFAGALPWLLPGHPGFGLFAGGLVLGLVLTRRPVPGTHRLARRLGVLATGLSTFVGVATVETLASHGWLDALLPAPLPLAIYGATTAGFLVLGLAAAHLAIAEDPVRTRYRAASAELHGELALLAKRAAETYRAAAEVLVARGGDRAEVLKVRDRLASVACRVVDLATQCQAVAAAVGGETESRLAEDIAALDEKIEAASDDVTRRQYVRAKETLATQQAQLDRIRVSRDRAVATMHGQLALLERARLSLVSLRSSDQSRLMAELAIVSEALDDASEAMDAESEAMLAMGV